MAGVKVVTVVADWQIQRVSGCGIHTTVVAFDDLFNCQFSQVVEMILIFSHPYLVDVIMVF